MTISNQEDVLDIRDVIARVEELRESRDEYDEQHGAGSWAKIDDGEPDELATLEVLLDDLAGYGGDEQWEGRWYPVTLIRDSYFEDYARELVEDIGDLPKGLPAYIEVDWEATARNIRADYCSVEFDDVTFWYR
ncbi:hypothetical protein CPT_Paku_008 [Burkholderia phage Paku]|uniref:Antirestriction protein ArdA n=1 Tax=Burkholderia phage Paku TaxID=2859650 RepID=A0AAE7WMP4_9CAUD|nr:hypothetical protein CPT_Paku_008 [Burkholderia phage Paku]